MPSCSLCPGRPFKNDDALQMHRKSKHSLKCEYCDREFTTDDGRLAHQKAKHPPMFECQYCDREFTTSQGRDAHEEAKHPTFECHHCDRKYNSEEARQQHEDAVHRPTFGCHSCDREFSSETSRQQHELAKHYFGCTHCSKSFTRIEALQLHEKIVPHFKCSYCTMEFFIQDSVKGHEKACSLNPANHVTRVGWGFYDIPSWRPSDLTSTKRVGEEFSTSLTIQRMDNRSDSPTSPSRSSGLVLDEGTTVDPCAHSPESCTCSVCQRASFMLSNTGNADHVAPTDDTHSPESCTCSVCQRASFMLPNTDNANVVAPSDEKCQDDPTEFRNVVSRCPLCLEVLETEEAFGNHVCAFRTTMPRPHCLLCYTQFDDRLLLEEHMKGLQSFSCHLCSNRCCSDEVLQDHLLSHPTCGKCGKLFANDHALCAHVESDHPAVACCDCDGIVVEKGGLELHYTDSSAHPSCPYCSLGKRNSVEMEEHIKHEHTFDAEMNSDIEDDNIKPFECWDWTRTSKKRKFQDGFTPAQKKTSGAHPEAITDGGLLSVDDRILGANMGETVRQLMKIHNSPLRTESTHFLSPQSPASLQAGPVNEAAVNSCLPNGEESPDADTRLYASPSPAPSEHGSDAKRSQSLASKATTTATNNDTRASSPALSASAEPFSATSSQNSLASSTQSVVFVSADGIPDYVRDNHAILIATSAGSPSSGCTPLRLSSSSSLDSLEIVEPIPKREERAPVVDNVARAGAGTGTTNRLHCRICLLDPCEDMTATICGHLFCRRCITQAVVANSECPACKNATLLYCLFKLDLSV